jgi:hypothetical protein
MKISKERRLAVSTNPGILLLYGAPKVGKTSMLSELKDCLIVDTERGARMVDGTILEVTSRDGLVDILKSLKGEKAPKFKYIAIDTIDKVAEWAERTVCTEENVSNIADLAFGKGYGLVREKVINTISAFNNICEHLIVVGHRKVAYAVTEGNQIVIPESLDLTGKLKNVVMSNCDAIGYVYREEDDTLMVSFKANHAIEAGSRCAHLKGNVVKFEWKNIYKEKK